METKPNSPCDLLEYVKEVVVLLGSFSDDLTRPLILASILVAIRERYIKVVGEFRYYKRVYSTGLLPVSKGRGCNLSGVF